MKRGALICVLGAISFGGCGGDDSSGSSSTGGTGGSTGGTGGSTGGTGGSTGGSGGSTGGSGGSTGGAAGATGGSAGTGGGSGGAAGATGGAAGTGGSTGGTGGSTGGTGGSTGGTGGSTGGTGGSTGGTGGTGGSSACGPTCGVAPYQCFDPVASMIVSPATNTTVDVTSNICPGTIVQVPYGGKATMQVQRNTPFFFIGTQTGSMTSFGIEYNVTSTFFPTLVSLSTLFAPTYPATVDPAWDASKKAIIHVVINATAGGSTAPCNSKDGVTFAVTGHPEAVVKYPNNGTATGTGGDAKGTITIVTTGTVANPEYVYVTATKTSCKLGLNGADKLFLTGRTPVAINVATTGGGFELSN